jgi:anti-sigma factor RsiW
METNEHRPIDDVMLSAWLDQELDPAERARVDDWLREHPADAERVRRWGADRDALGARLGSVLAEAVPERLGQLIWTGTAPSAAPSHTRSHGWRLARDGRFFVVGGVVEQPRCGRAAPSAVSGIGCVGSPRGSARRLCA